MNNKRSCALAEPRARLGHAELVALIFFTVSGGAYGIESLVGSLGAGWALLLVLVTPLVWSIPTAWMVAELSALLPAEGGYYVWVREGLGEFWGFQEGWWTICYTAVDMALYPVLFVDYLAYFHPSLLALPLAGPVPVRVFAARWLVALGVVVSAFLLNLRGARRVGQSAIVAMSLVLAPFAVLTVAGFLRRGALGAMAEALKAGFSRRRGASLLALGLSTVMWNYSGWDNVSTFAGEVRDARSTYPAALAIAQALIVGAYVLPLLAGLSAVTNPAVWRESAGWPNIAQAVAGPWLGLLVAAVAVVSAWSLFNSQLLYVSRLPYAMAVDGWLPGIVGRVSLRQGVPVVSLGLACAVAAALAAFPFTKLVVLDILLYSAELLLEFLALIALRRKRPGAERAVRVPGGLPGAVLTSALPIGLAGVVTVACVEAGGADSWQAGILLAVILSGILMYAGRRRSCEVKPAPAVGAASPVKEQNGIAVD